MHSLPSFARWFYPFFLGSILVEVGWYLIIWKRTYPWRETLVSLGIFALHLPVRFASNLLTAPVIYFAWTHRIATVPLDTAWGLALLFLGEELAYYWLHRTGHEVRWAWATHSAHHTPERIHLASAFRLGITEVISGTWLFFVPLSFVGFDPLAVRMMFALNLFYQFWLHTELIGTLGPLELIFNTPTHHRIHHASNEDYLDRNYGGILIVFDRFFGTFAAAREDIRIVYGLVHPVGSTNPVKILFHEWRAIAHDVRHARSWRERWSQAFGRPGTWPAEKEREEKAAIAVSSP